MVAVAQVMAAQDHDGGGLLEGTAADYELDSLTSVDFTFSAWAGDNPWSGSGDNSFTEDALNRATERFFTA